MALEINTLYTNKTVLSANTSGRKLYAVFRLVLFGVFAASLHPLRALYALLATLTEPLTILLLIGAAIGYVTEPTTSLQLTLYIAAPAYAIPRWMLRVSH